MLYDTRTQEMRKNRTITFDEISSKELAELRKLLRSASDSDAIRRAIHAALIEERKTARQEAM